MGGILALILADVEGDNAAVDLHEALYALQYRRQDICDIATSTKAERIYSCKGQGMGSKVFRDGLLIPELPGFMGLWPPPLPHGRHFIKRRNSTFLPTSDSDSEIMLQVFASQLLQADKRRMDCDDLFTGLTNKYRFTIGGFAFCGMVAGFPIFGARDPNGIRPLAMGSRPNRDGKCLDYMLASESAALDQLGFTAVVDIQPGQAAIIPKGGSPVFRQVHPQLSYAPDLFEYCCLSRPGSIIDGISVYETRQRMGLDLVPIPKSGIVPALSVAEDLKRPYCHALSRNRYIFRTFNMPNQERRHKGVQSKLDALRSEFEGRNVILVDDTIMRGTTSLQVCSMAREAGAKKVYFASSSPPVTHPHIYGIDLATSSELVAYYRDRKAIATSINADDIVYLSLNDLEASCAEPEHSR
ncbi:amidophosphoribosyltransferase [Xylariaceae sp. FL1019]|nr:amidophosphoribosyltransferase [Xylariaceae sp. FL1019]